MNSSEFEARTARLEWRLRLMMAAWAITIAALLFGGWQSPDRHNVITAKRLVIEDEHGVQRLILGAPAPDPMMHGQLVKRKSPFAGLIINDAKGDERGGIGMMDDGTMSMGFDQNGRERTVVYVLPNGKAGILINDPQGRDRISIASEPDGMPKIQFFDEHQRPSLSLPEAK